MQPTTPTPTPTPAPPAFDPVIELVHKERQNVGYALAIAAAVCLAATGWCAMKTTRATVPPPDATKGAKDKDDALKALQDATEIAQPNRDEYILGGLSAFLLALSRASVGGFLIAAPPKGTEEEQRTQARLVVLVLGAALGASLMLAGMAFFYVWSGSLMKWLDKGELVEARWVLIPLLTVVVGGALMFVTTQPARAEERNNANLRQFIYGSNFGLTVIMMFVVLVIVNAVIAMRVPNKLDTTQTGFYSLSPQTKQLLEGLDQPVRAYAIFQDGGDLITEDAKRLLMSCQDVNPSKFRVTLLSPALNKTDIAKLKNEFPLAEMNREGVLLVVGEDGAGERKRHSFLARSDFSSDKPGPDGRPVDAFDGEPKLLRELMFLAESKQKPKIYFTQSSGELGLAGGGQKSNPRRSASALKGYLEKNYFEVAELSFDVGAAAKVPDDAAVVVIADPTAPLPANGVEALRKYMTDVGASGKKGKLVVLAGAQPGADQKPLKLGIEPVLETFGVRLSDRFLYGKPIPQLGELDRASGVRTNLVLITQEALDARNQVALGFTKIDQLPLVDCRELNSSPAAGSQPVTVLATQPGRLTWTEAQVARNPVEAWSDLTEGVERINAGPGTAAEKQRAISELLKPLQVSNSPRELAVFVSEGPTARVAVFGCGWFVTDEANGLASRRQLGTLWFDLMGSTLDWARDRKTVTGVQEKQYSTYTLKPGSDGLRLVWLPLGLTILVIAGFGAGTWVIRRK